VKSPWRFVVAPVLALAVLTVAGCANLGYYWQSASGHLKVMGAAKPVQEWIDDPSTPPKLKERLALARRIRAWAASELHLPDNASYTRYADLHRSAVVWNVVAAPALSLELKTWCFPVLGCVGYRGYFDEAAAKHESEVLAAEGWESAWYPVPAYSTLGWMNWAGGDPLLSTFINYPDGELARLVFHELAHQEVYVAGDTMFNESFAVAVERLGGERWLATQAGEAARNEYAVYDGRRRQFRELMRATRERLQRIYDGKEAGARTDAARTAMKNVAMQEFREQYAKLRDSWGGDPARFRASNDWVARANNASFGAQAAYDELVPGFEALFHRNGDDWLRFYDAARALAKLPKDERRKQLKELAGA
jgi:predicted aminopeptidase